MHVIVIASAIVGFNLAAPLTIGGVLAFIGDASQVGQGAVAIQQRLDTPQFREWAAQNGGVAINLQPGARQER